MALQERDQVPQRATIRDIAQRAGVSIATVSRVLNGRPDVSARTRAHVLKVVQEQRYSSNPNAQALARGRTGLIGVTLPFIYPEYFNRIMSGAAESLYPRDARFVVCPTQHQRDREVSLLRRLMQGSTDGSILIVPSEEPEELTRLREAGYPFVVIDPMHALDESIPVVSAGNWAGARSATDFLLQLGHRSIGIIAGPSSWNTTQGRLAGCHSALQKAGVSSAAIVHADFTIGGGYEAACDLLECPQRPTAILAFNDNMAAGALRAAWERHLLVPQDLSVVGFDDVEIAIAATPQLTTVRQPLEEMGRMGVDLLYRVMDGTPIDATRTELSTRLIVRESTAPPGTPRVA